MCDTRVRTVIGAMYSMKLLMESTMKGAFMPLYNYVYNYTLETMPSTFFLISVVLTVPLMVIFGQVFSLIDELLPLDKLMSGRPSFLAASNFHKIKPDLLLTGPVLRDTFRVDLMCREKKKRKSLTKNTFCTNDLPQDTTKVLFKTVCRLILLKRDV